jgi:hypothetical protein
MLIRGGCISLVMLLAAPAPLVANVVTDWDETPLCIHQRWPLASDKSAVE